MTEDEQEPAEAVDDPDVPIAQAGTLACGNGTPWLDCLAGPCAGCLAETERGRVEMAAAVAAGEFDVHGYEPKDRKYGGQGDLFG